MKTSEQSHFNTLYARHLKLLKLRGLSDSTIAGYSRAIRRISTYYDCSPDHLSTDQLEDYFVQLIDSHSWSTVKLDRNGLQFFWRYVLNSDWTWLKMIKPPRVQNLPDILTPREVNHLIMATTQRRYRTFLLTAYSMGLRLSEALSLQVSDIDAEMMQVHIRRGKGHKDRFVPMPELTYRSLQQLWKQHRNPNWLFPNARGSMETISQATTHMNKGSVQSAMKAVVKDAGIKKKFQSTLCATVTPLTYLNRD